MLASLRTLFRYRALISSLVARELRARYRGSVLGVVWSLTNACEAALDDYEEIATGLYTKASIKFQDTPVLVYLATNGLPGHPLAGYLEAIIAEAYRRGFDPAYITQYLKPWMERRPTAP